MTSNADKLPLETEPVARDNNTILTLKRGDQTLSRLTQLIIVVLFSEQFCGISAKTHEDYFEFSNIDLGKTREAMKFLIKKEQLLPDHYHRESTLYGKSELFCAEMKSSS